MLTEWITPDDTKDQTRKSIAVALDALNNRLDCVPIGWTKPSSQGVGEKLFGQTMDKIIAPAPEQSPELIGTIEGNAAKVSGGVNSLAAILIAPGANGVEVFETETQRVHPLVARSALWVGAMALESLPQRSR